MGHRLVGVVCLLGEGLHHGKEGTAAVLGGWRCEGGGGHGEGVVREEKNPARKEDPGLLGCD